MRSKKKACKIQRNPATTKIDTASSLPAELIQEILVRLPPDEPANLVRASVVCKAWRRALADRDWFLRRCCRVHGPTPPLLGYIQNGYFKGPSMQFVPATPSIVRRMPAAADYSEWVAVDCRHGRVLLFHFADTLSKIPSGLVVWDPITGSQQHLSVPFSGYPAYTFSNFTGAVLCAMDGCDDHLDCSHGGPFRVVFVETNFHKPIFELATSYSSLTGQWSAPTPCHVTSENIYYRYRGDHKPSLLVGGFIYFLSEDTTTILRYHVRTHWLSEIRKPRAVRKAPRAVFQAFLMKAEDGGLGLVSLSDNSIYMWSRQDVTDDIDGWVRHKAIKLQTLLPRGVKPCELDQVVGFAEGTNIVFVKISATIFMLNLKSKKVRKVGETEDKRIDIDPILPYVSFYTPRLSNRQ